MILAVDVPPSVAADVLNQALQSLPPGLEPFSGSIQLGEAFEVWSLRNFPHPGDDMSVAAVQTGSLHHQLFAHGDPAGFVRSRLVPGGPSREVTQVFMSPLARRIHESVAAAGPHVASGIPARLVTAPAYRLFALWFSDVAQSYVVSCPGTYTKIRPGELLGSTDFMARLRQEPPVSGATIQ